MSAIMQYTLKPLDAEELKKLARCEGPCVTVQIPDFRPGAPAGSRHARMRQLTQTAAAQLRDLNRPEETGVVLESLERVAGDVDSEHGGPGVTLFCAPGVEAAFTTPSVQESVVVGKRFHLTPLIAAASVAHETYALGLNKKHTRLWRITDLRCEELALPASVPVSVEAAGAFDPPDHDLENRATGGPSTGSMKGVRFGTGTGRDTAPEYLHNFFLLIHRGLKETVKSAPVFLIGVHEETAEYRRAAKGNGLLETEWNTTPEFVALDDVAAHAREAALDHYHRTAEALVRKFPEAAHKISGDMAAIGKAAREGRVHQLLIAQNGRPAEAVNSIAIETLRTGGEVYTLPVDELGGIGAAGAILRY